MNNVINNFGNEMFWGANQIQIGKLSNTKDMTGISCFPQSMHQEGVSTKNI